MHVIVRIQWRAENVIFPAGEAGQRMHIRAAYRSVMLIFGKSGATTKTYGVEPNPIQEQGPVMMAKKTRLLGRARQAVGGL